MPLGPTTKGSWPPLDTACGERCSYARPPTRGFRAPRDHDRAWPGSHHGMGGAMAESGSETRQRDERHTVRFTPLEDALVCAKASAAGVPVATFLRNTALAFPMPRAPGARPRTTRTSRCCWAGSASWPRPSGARPRLRTRKRSRRRLPISRSFAFCVSPPWGASHDPGSSPHGLTGSSHGYIARH
ncbi:hypothetical protein ABID65_008817 [Bradyrhizobium sp. S3.9.2]